MCELDLRRLHSGLQYLMEAFRAARSISSKFRRKEII
jgi:hypothetical protein